MAPDFLATTVDWTTENMDHKMVSVKLAHHETPFIGKGRWTFPLFLLKDTKLMDGIMKEGKSLYEKLLTMMERSTESPQELYKKFKDEIREKAREQAKILILRMKKEIEKLKKRPE